VATSARPRKTQPAKLASVDTSDLEPRRPAQSGPIVVGQSPVEMAPVFVLDDVTYSIPAKLNPLLTMRHQELIKKDGPLEATQWLLRRLFGQPVIDALEESPHVSAEDVVAICEKVSSILYPPSENAAATTGN
jgi:hypothetical protein